MFIQDYEDSGYVLADESLSIHSKQFKFFRRALRLFGFWHPPDACFIERIIYPLLINLLLLCILVSDVYSIINYILAHPSDKTANLILEISASISRYIWAWLCHTLTVKYFKRRSLERKLFNLEIKHEFREDFNNMTCKLNWILTVSIFHGVLSCALSIVAGEYLSYPSRWTRDTEKHHKINTTNTQHEQFFTALTLLISISDLYIVPIQLCLTWLMYILSKTSRMRLIKLKHEYMSWNQQAEQAIFRHYTFYTKQVQSNCKALELLFLSHNILMTIITPQQFFLCMEVSKTKGALDFGIFLYYFLTPLIFWITPLYFAESLRRYEERFYNEINNFCPQYFEINCTGKELDDICDAPGIFGSRTEVNNLTLYLQGRKSGFLIGFYSFQLHLSMVSFYIGLLMLIIRIASG